MKFKATLLPALLALSVLFAPSASGCRTLNTAPNSTTDPASETARLAELTKLVDAAAKVVDAAAAAQSFEIEMHKLAKPEGGKYITDADHVRIQSGFKLFSTVAVRSLAVARDATQSGATRRDAVRSIARAGTQLAADLGATGWLAAAAKAIEAASLVLNI